MKSVTKPQVLPLAQELIHLEGMARIDLIACWRRLFKTRPAKNLSSPMMRRIIGYEIQCQSLGGLSARAQRALKPLSKTGLSAYNKPKSRGVPLLKPGTQLIREWNGRPYCVEASDDGFIMDGKSYRSLSAVAKQITGTHWSGPRFFGLKSAGGEL